MLTFLGWVLVIVAVVLLVSAFRRPEPTSSTGPEPGRPNKPYLWAGVACLVAGLLMAMSSTIALARLETLPLSRSDNWRSNPPVGPDAPIRWEGNALLADLEAGSGRYAVYPVDWNADRFEAEWDIIFSQLDVKRERDARSGARSVRRARPEAASVAIGLMDQSVSNIDDKDHVGGSALQACFSDDIRLRAADANFIVRTASSDESGKAEIDPNFKPGEPVRIELNTKYHCRITYDRPSSEAVLVVRDDAGREVVTRRLEDVKDFTNSVSWFGVSVRGYNRFDKKLDARKAENGYKRPLASVRIENMRYRQP
jgi:hypothetical protein